MTAIVEEKNRNEFNKFLKKHKIIQTYKKMRSLWNGKETKFIDSTDDVV